MKKGTTEIIFLIISSTILFWIILQFLLFKVTVPRFLEVIFGFFINFNMVFFFILPLATILSIILIIKKRKYGWTVFAINLISTLMFYNGDWILKVIR